VNETQKPLENDDEIPAAAPCLKPGGGKFLGGDQSVDNRNEMRNLSGLRMSVIVSPRHSRPARRAKPVSSRTLSMYEKGITHDKSYP